jgi:DNA repair exonuclease SbcCD ATPase subunit
MRRYLFGLGVCLYVSAFVHGDELMSKRMQSVVDEVSELRERYEYALEKNKACIDQVNEQQKTMKKISHEQGYDYELFEKNRKRLSILEAENVELKKRPVSSSADEKKKFDALNKEIAAIQRENQRLQSSAQILVEKNHSLLEQITKFKHSSSDESNTIDVKQLEAFQSDLESTQQENERLLAEKSALSEENKGLIIKVKTLEAQMQTADKELKTTPVRNDDKYTAVQSELEAQREKNKKLQESSDLIEANLLEKLEEKERELVELKEKLVLATSSSDCHPKKVITVCQDDNPFPQLMMKEKKSIEPLETEVQMVIEVKKTPTVTVKRITTEKACVYRMNKEAEIYDAPYGKSVDRWEEKTSFTSNIHEGEWIKITGFFVDRKWQKAEKEMWVKAEDTLKR